MKPDINKNNSMDQKNEEKALLVKNENNSNRSHPLNLDETQESKKTEFSFRRIGDLQISEKIKLTAFMIIAMAVLRIFSFDLFVMIGELLTAIIVYLYSIWNNKCMAVLVAINGISGFVYSFIQIFRNILTAKSEKFGYIATINLIVSIFATLVYGIVIYLAYYGFRHFELLKFAKHDDKETKENKEDNANGNETSQYGALEKDDTNANGQGKKEGNSSDKEKKDKDNSILDNLGSIGEKAKAAGENLNKIKEGVDQVGEVLNKLGNK